VEERHERDTDESCGDRHYQDAEINPDNKQSGRIQAIKISLEHGKKESPQHNS